MIVDETHGKPFAPTYYNEAELRAFGFREVGSNVRIAKSCTIIGIPNISFGSNVRIDGGVVISAPGPRVEIGSYVHIGGCCFLFGAGGISIGDFCTTSQGVKIYSGSDDYSGDYMTNPTLPKEVRNVECAKVELGRHTIVGSTSVILPGCVIGEGCAIGALSLVTRSLQPWGIYAGAPARLVKARSKRLLELESKVPR